MIRAPALTALICLVCAAAAHAGSSTVLVLDDGRVSTRSEQFAGPTELPGMAPAARQGAAPWARAAATRRAPRGRATRQAIDKLLADALITQAERDARQRTLRSVLRTHKALTGTRQAQLRTVIDNADTIAAAGELTPSRLHPVFLTLAANQQWWRDGPLLRNGQRVAVGDNPLVWQHYAGQGIQLQMLANFGKANALWSGRRRTALRALLAELVPLATDRGDWISWDYYFRFGTGKPPWTSSISQGTAVQVMGRAAQLLADPLYTERGSRALGAFEQTTPAGVRVDTRSGPFYAIYSYAPTLQVLNAHAQALVGLYDFANLTGDQRALALFQDGDRTLQASLPVYDTGKWSLYDQTREADRAYHDLNTTFLRNLCTRTGTVAYCDAATRFRSYLAVPPVVAAPSQRIRSGKPARLRFTLDKVSRVGLVVTRGERTVFATSATVGRGERYFSWSRPAAPGIYELRVRATDLAGNQSESAVANLRILSARTG